MVRLALFLGLIALLLLAGCAFVTWLADVLPGWIRPGTGPNWPVVLGFGLGVVGVSGLILYGLRRLVLPIGDLIEAVGRVEAGDYEAHVAVRGPREVETLARAFNAMVGRLKEDEVSRRALLADVSHELKTPLTVIRGSLEALVDGVYPADPEHLTPILEETRQLSLLIDDLRTLSAAEAGGLRLRREPTDLGVLAEEAAAAYRTSAAADGIRIQIDIPPDFPLVEVDPGRIRQVLANLIANALRYSPRPGAIWIAASERSDGWAEITVRDEGEGIDPEVLPFLFERFAKSPDSSGSGLGLAIARRLAEAHGGELHAESEAGAGTSMRLTIPLED